MPGYVRPTLPQLAFYDQTGARIAYGDRWPSRVAPKDTYSVVTHPERFAPLYLVADALVEHLAASYEVSVSDDIAHAAGLLDERYDVVRSVQIVPLKPDAATLTFVYTSFPAVIVHAGLLHDFPFPDCGCDACDDSIDGVADGIERIVFAVVRGGYSEWVEPHFIGYRLLTAGGIGSGSGRSRRSSRYSDRVEDAARRLSQLTGGWEPWSPRESQPIGH